ncbi:7-carboxy-7-deazaguanine synthase QueE [Actinomadura atramentaria]|uniref:7-carboxy-7-deazaguanine synthase QueE n=1 Tax=Actinomadura atramentaria TaxID=1990 RepID=UPI000369B687|nr:7-carboxy-7-deazaguanine synthase QueE [Actinomadura atramentaria]
MASVLRVAELFGPTLQGEGPSLGRHAAFVRLSGCNLACSWCDTPWTWQWRVYDRAAEQTAMPVDAVRDWARGRADLVVITGGEPLLQAGPVAELVAGLAGTAVEIETNGTVAPPPELLVEHVAFNVSPKLAGAGGPEHRRLRERALRALADSGRARFKFVVADAAELDEVARVQAAHGLDDVWIMPEATSAGRLLELLRDLADPVIERGWNLAPRLQVLLWEDARGR